MLHILIKTFFLLSVISISIYSQPASEIFYPRYHDYNYDVYSNNLNGTDESSFSVTLRPKAIAVDWMSTPHKLYIGLIPSSGAGKIIKCNVDGSEQEDVVTDLYGINDIELDLINRKIYWLQNTSNDDRIWKADMDALNSNVDYIYSTTTTFRELWGLALDASTQTLWITERGSNCYASYIRRMTCSGSGVTTIMNPVCNPHDIEFYNGKIYFGSTDGLVSTDSDGDGLEIIISEADVEGLAIDGTNDRIYWVDYSSNVIKRVDISGANEIQVSSTISVLARVDTDYNPEAVPVELTSFTANVKNDAIVLKWETATEVNNYGFEIERSENLQGFTSIGFVEGAGNSNTPKSYSFTIDQKFPGNTIYRLKQIDTDGSFKYSKEIIVETLPATSIPAEFLLEQNYPNPFNPVTTIKYSIPLETRGIVSVQLKVFDLLGQEVATLVNMKQKAGKYEVNFDAGGLTSGIYFYKLQAGGFSSVKKLILMK